MSNICFGDIQDVYDMGDPMELRHLRYFIAVADELHFGRAAARLHIAQPPLSQQIRRLEEELQAPLLRRTSRHVELTAAGRLFLHEAKLIVAQADRAVRIARRASEGEIGQLLVGCTPWADFTSGPNVIRGFGKRHPHVEVELHSLASAEQISALEEGRIDVGILRPPVHSQALMTESLLAERLVVAFPRGHRFAHHDRVPWRELAHEAYVLLSRRRAPSFDTVVSQACTEAGLTLSVRYEVDHPQAVLALVAAGLGVSLAPATFGPLKTAGIAYRGLLPAGPVLETIIAWRREGASPLVPRFLRVARDLVRPRRRPSSGATAGRGTRSRSVGRSRPPSSLA
jgi:DNA-binding transcriptional LysR family regulator